jgi:hypothetical protein
MNKYFFILLSFFTLNCTAQVMHMSFGGHYYKQKGALLEAFDPGTAAGDVYYSTAVDEKSAVPGIGFYYYKYFLEPSDNISFGVQTGFDFFAFFEAPKDVQNQYGQKIGEEGGSSLVAGYSIPVYAMGRFGSQATEEVGDGLGIALGAGINLFGFTIPSEKGFMVPFSIATEITYRKFGLRLDLPLKKFESHYPSYTGDIPRLSNSFFSVELTFLLGGN